MNEPLEQAIDTLPKAIAPSHDLWPAIEARILSEEHSKAQNKASPAWAPGWNRDWRAAAAVLVMLGGGALAVMLMRAPGEVANVAQAPQPAQTNPILSSVPPVGQATPTAMPLLPDTAAPRSPMATRILPVDYLVTRGELDQAMTQTLQQLGPETRAVVEANLLEIRNALQQIDAALAQEPGNRSLQQLLVSTSSQELRYMTDIRQLTARALQEREL